MLWRIYTYLYIYIIYTIFFIPIFPSDTPQQFWLETCKCTTWLSVPRLLKIVVLECSIPTQKLSTPPFEFVACTQKHSITLRKNLIVTSGPLHLIMFITKDSEEKPVTFAEETCCSKSSWCSWCACSTMRRTCQGWRCESSSNYRSYKAI